MRTSICSISLLASTLALAPGCDDAGSVLEEGGGEAAFRCLGASCGVGGIGNTSMIGDHPLSNLAEVFKMSATNHTAGISIEGGTAYYDSALLTITEIDVGADGELRLELESEVWIGGEDVVGATFDLLVEPLDLGEPPFGAQLKIADARCEAGRYEPSMTICSYQFVTDVEPKDEDLYPMIEGDGGWYHTCPDEDEAGRLGDEYKFSSVLSPNVSLSFSSVTGPSVDVGKGTFINGCINGAVSKGQYWLNAFYDSNAYRGLDPSQRTAMLRMWMAWHDGEPRTVPGMLISPYDPIGGLFTWNSLPDWDIEAGYSETGATCRGGSLERGVHRYIIDPVLNLAGWASLPRCDENTLHDHAVLGVKVQAEVW